MATKKESDAAKKKKGNSWYIEKSISISPSPLENAAVRDKYIAAEREKNIKARRKFNELLNKQNEENKAIKQADEPSLLAIRLKRDEDIKATESASQKEAETLNPREQEEILLPSVQTVYQYVKILGLPLSEILDKLNTEGYRCFVGSDLIPETRKILDNIYRNLQFDSKNFSEVEERRKEIEKIQVDLMKKASTSVNFSAPKITIWGGRMFCHKCGYSWNSTRTTPPGKCAKCGSQNILAIKQ